MIEEWGQAQVVLETACGMGCLALGTVDHVGLEEVEPILRFGQNMETNVVMMCLLGFLE